MNEVKRNVSSCERINVWEQVIAASKHDGCDVCRMQTVKILDEA